MTARTMSRNNHVILSHLDMSPPGKQFTIIHLEMHSRQVCHLVLSKNDMMWMTERGRGSERGRLLKETDFSGSCQQTSTSSPLLLLGRGLSLLSLPLCFTSSHPGEIQRFWSVNLSSRRGTEEESLAKPICPMFLVNCVLKEAAWCLQLRMNAVVR